MTKNLFIACVILSAITNSIQLNTETRQQNNSDRKNPNEKILSRRKRFLIFPTGSSVSVATCMTVGVYGNPQFSIFSWAVNYGFAYNLPTNASYFLHPPPDIMTFPFYTPDENATTTTTTTEAPVIIHDDHDHHHDHDHESDKSSNRRFFVYQKPQKFETQPMIHRRYRRDVYRSIEAVIDKMGYNGRDCILQSLCESSTMFPKKKRRTMVQEMIKTVFTMPKSKVLSFEHPELMMYDDAFRNGPKRGNCERLYPKCNFSLIKLVLGRYSKSPNVGFM